MSDFNFYNAYFKPNRGISKIVPDPRYNPNNAIRLVSGTKLAKGVTIGKFLGAAGEKTNLNHIVTATERLNIARQLYLQAMAMNTINTNIGKFQNYFASTFIVVDNSTGANAKGAAQSAYKKIAAWAKKVPIENPRDKKWVDAQRGK